MVIKSKVIQLDEFITNNKSLGYYSTIYYKHYFLNFMFKKPINKDKLKVAVL